MDLKSIQDPGLNAFSRLQKDLKWAAPESIDEFVRHTSPHHAAAAFGVALCLLRAEQNHALSLDHEDDWLRTAFNSHTESIKNDPEPNVSFITYNYDRLIERHMMTRLAGYRTACDFYDRFARIPIVHLHGALGTLSKIPKAGGTPYIFADLNADTVVAATNSASALRFFWEENQDIVQFDRARRLLVSADRIVILGIGQAFQPLSRLLSGFSDNWWNGVDIFATAYLLPQAGRERLLSLISKARKYKLCTHTAKKCLTDDVYA
ncbi:MAG: hypothetical protein KF691_13090 [Phycisphaeraceae bacterium]|nr:hypothetical protein [Phycisphaeraceae bacterium]